MIEDENPDAEIFVKESIFIALLTTFILIFFAFLKDISFEMFIFAGFFPFIVLGPILMKLKFKKVFNF